MPWYPAPGRRRFCLSALALLARPGLAAAGDNAILVNAALAGRMRDAIRNDSAFRAAADRVRANADAALRVGPWSVTNHRPDHVQAGPHDYYSEGPYWWPDPKNPTGPYIRKDGERNPGRFMGNRSDLGEMCTAVLALGMGAWLLGERRYADRAATVLSVWFLDAKTRMNPHLEFGQAVRGINTGRGTGIIDTVSLIHVTQGIRLLELAEAFEGRIGEGLRGWFAGYLRWMTTSAKGLDEKKATNNHATWWTAQAAAYATLVGDQSTQAMAWDYYRGYLAPTEIRPDGSCPREEARTDSLGYSSMNLDGFSVLCRIAEQNGVNLWSAVKKACLYLMPFVEHPETWHKQQIAKYSADGVIFPGLAGVGLHSARLLEGYRSLARSRSPWVQFVDLVVRTAAKPGD